MQFTEDTFIGSLCIAYSGYDKIWYCIIRFLQVKEINNLQSDRRWDIIGGTNFTDHDHCNNIWELYTE